MSNNITVVGNLTDDCALKYTQAGVAMVSGSIASNRRYQVNGQWEETTSFFNFTAWRELAENMAATLTKGTRVVAVGRMEQKKWVDKEGANRTSYELIIDEIGPSVRWATAVITKITSSNSTGNATVATAKAAFPNAQVTEEDPF